MKLSKSTLYAINWLYSNGSTVEDIAEELKVSQVSVQQYIEKHHVQDKPEIANKSERVKSKSKDLMIRHTKEKQTNNVSIMTREASAFNDNAKKKFRDKGINQEHIFRPNDK